MGLGPGPGPGPGLWLGIWICLELGLEIGRRLRLMLHLLPGSQAPSRGYCTSGLPSPSTSAACITTPRLDISSLVWSSRLSCSHGYAMMRKKCAYYYDATPHPRPQPYPYPYPFPHHHPTKSLHLRLRLILTSPSRSALPFTLSPTLSSAP